MKEIDKYALVSFFWNKWGVVRRPMSEHKNSRMKQNIDSLNAISVDSVFWNFAKNIFTFRVEEYIFSFLRQKMFEKNLTVVCIVIRRSSRENDVTLCRCN